MIVLGLDQAPRGIGFAFGEPGAVPVVGYHSNPGFGDNTSRLSQHVYDWASELIRTVRPQVIYYEQVLVNLQRVEINTLWKQMAVVNSIELACAHLGMSDACFLVLIADWRRHFFNGRRPGHTAADWKALALLECEHRGWPQDNHHIAEACGIWSYACSLQQQEGKQHES